MEIQYVIINFLILAVILFVFGRKTAVSIFKNRYDRVNRELDEAEEILASDLVATPDEENTITETSVDYDVSEARKVADSKLSQLKSFEERECREIHRMMIEDARNGLFEILKKKTSELFLQEPYRSRIRALESDIVDKILSQIKLTSGDMSYLKHSDVLYVTLTSAFPLPEELVKKVDKATTELLETVNGKTSLWVIEDPELVGGLKLRIGDTVYDGTVVEEFYHFKRRLNREPIFDSDASDTLLKEFLEKAENYEPEIYNYQLGRVMTVSDGICWMDGLADIMYGEVIEFECGERGMVLDIQQNRIGCVIFGSYEHIDSGSRVRRVGRMATVPVGESLLGRVVDARGNAIDGEGYLPFTERRPIEFKSPAILDRSPVNTPLHTGLKAIDTLVPIGKGQRELIIGDRQTGKTAIAVDAILNQKGKDTICIYVAIGQKETLVAEIREKLKEHGALDYTTIVSAPASESAALQYIAPFSGSAMAEYFMYKGKDVLIIYDDLSKHAVAYRELSLLLHRPSGREAYPGDIFYLHSRLLERAAHLSDELGGGSITAIPIVETQAGDISAYIPTNVISITDGQIFLDTELFYEGQRPAINVGLSVSRVGGSAQTKLTKQISGNLRAKLAQYRELADFMQFGSDIDEATKKTLDSGRQLMEALKQPRYKPIPDYLQAVLIFAVSEGYATHIETGRIEKYERELYSYLETECKELTERLKTGNKMDEQTKNDLKTALETFAKRG